MRPSTPRSLVKFAARPASVTTGCVQLDARPAPRCRTRCRRLARPGHRHGDDGRGGVVRADRTTASLGAQPSATSGSSAPTASPGRPARRTAGAGSRARPSSGSSHSPVRTSSSPVVEAFVRSVRGSAGQPVGEQVGDQQHPVAPSASARLGGAAGRRVLNGRNCRPLRGVELGVRRPRRARARRPPRCARRGSGTAVPSSRPPRSSP